MMPSRPEPKVVGYSKTAPFQGSSGYLLWEVKSHMMFDGISSENDAIEPKEVSSELYKTPIPEFLRNVLR